MPSGCLGEPPTREPPLTCFITCLTLFSVSSTTRFTPKAPGLIWPKIYQQEKEKLSGNARDFALFKVCSAPSPLLPQLLLQDGRVSVSTTFCREGNAQNAEEPEPISLGPILELFPSPYTASPTCSRDPWASKSWHPPGAELYSLSLATYYPSFQHPPPN